VKDLVLIEETASEIARRMKAALQATLAPEMKKALSLEAKPEPAWNETTTPDEAFINVVPPADQHVYLMILFGSVGTDGDALELQIYCECHSAWQKFLRVRSLARLPIAHAFPNMKLDKVWTLEAEHIVAKGDGESPRFRVVSRGTGPWEAGVIYYSGS